jgi:uncharacterized protein
MFRGFGTLLDVAMVVVGSGIGMLTGQRFPARTREVVTDGLGLVVLLVAALNAAAVLDARFASAVGEAATLLIVLGSLLIGGVAGSLLDLESRLERIGDVLQAQLVERRGARTVSAEDGAAARRRFIEGFVSASLLFCVGPLMVLGSLADGLGQGYDQLALKAVVDGFAAIAFAATFGIGAMASALAILVVQGSLTVLGAIVGGFLQVTHILAMTATGGLLLVGGALRLLRIRELRVVDLLPALLVAPLLTEIMVRLR